MSSAPESVRAVRRPRVLIVDDDSLLLDGLMRLLRRAEPTWDVRRAANGEEALAVLQAETIDVVVTDLNMPGVNGYELLRELERSHAGTFRILHSSHGETMRARKMARLAHMLLPKPMSSSELIDSLRSAVRATQNPARLAQA